MPDIISDFPSDNALVRYRDVVYAIISGEVARRQSGIPDDRRRSLFEANFDRLRELDGLRLHALLAGKQAPLTVSVPEMGKILDDLAKRCRGLFECSEHTLTPAFDSEYRDTVAALTTIDDLIFTLRMEAAPNSTVPKNAPQNSSAPVSAEALAHSIGLPTVDNALDQFLRRFRDRCPDSYVEVSDPRKGEPRYLYRPDDVLPDLMAWSAKRRRAEKKRR